jgi:hypothetical protein
MEEHVIVQVFESWLFPEFRRVCPKAKENDRNWLLRRLLAEPDKAYSVVCQEDRRTVFEDFLASVFRDVRWIPPDFISAGFGEKGFEEARILQWFRTESHTGPIQGGDFIRCDECEELFYGFCFELGDFCMGCLHRARRRVKEETEWVLEEIARRAPFLDDHELEMFRESWRRPHWDGSNLPGPLHTLYLMAGTEDKEEIVQLLVRKALGPDWPHEFLKKCGEHFGLDLGRLPASIKCRDCGELKSQGQMKSRLCWVCWGTR